MLFLWLINSLSYTLIMEPARSDAQTANHLTDVLFGCTTYTSKTTEQLRWELSLTFNKSVYPKDAFT